MKSVRFLARLFLPPTSGPRSKKRAYLGRVLKNIINFKDVLTYFPVTKCKKLQCVRACWTPAIPMTAPAREEEEEE